jgi:DNA-binding transcriptional MocR family regulator
MSDYRAMDKAALQAEREKLRAAYQQFAANGLRLDMSRGKPAANQLDLSDRLLTMDDHIDEDGVDARNYGNLEGLGEARRYFAQLMGAEVAETLVCGNSSLDMMYHMVDLGWRLGWKGHRPWKDCGVIKFLCPSPGYDRHFRVTESFGFDLVTVPMTPAGPDMDSVEALVRDEAVKGMWTVPVYSNPDGYTCSEETVRRMAAMKTAASDFRIIWDNAYGWHHLTDVHEGCPNLLEECKKAGHAERALMLMSTSKITCAGAGVCAVAAGKANVDDLKAYLFPMTISFDKVNQLRHVRFLKKVGLDAHMKRHAALLKPKFDMVVRTLHNGLDDCGGIARWTEPRGGYFISLYVMPGCAARVVTLCRQAGVALTGAGAAYPYGKDPDDAHIRIAPSYPPAEELAEAAQLMCLATRLASVEKLLEQYEPCGGSNEEKG